MRFPITLAVFLVLVFATCSVRQASAQLRGEKPENEVSRQLADHWRSLEKDGVSKVDVARFAGFCEGLTSIAPPRWWEEQLWATANGALSSARPTRPALPVTLVANGDEDATTFLITDFEDVEFRFRLPDFDDDFSELKAYAAGEAVYIVEDNHSEIGRVFKYSLARRSVEWTKTLTLQPRIGGGPFSQTIELAADRSSRKIALFGIMSPYVYSIGLDAASGDVEWSFRCMLVADTKAPIFAEPAVDHP